MPACGATFNAARLELGQRWVVGSHRRVWSWTIQTGWLKDRVRVSHARRAPFRVATWATRSNPVDVSTTRLPLPAVPEGTAGRAIERLPALSRLVTKLSCHRCTWYVIMPHAHCFSRTSLRRGSSRAARNVGASCVPEPQDALRRQTWKGTSACPFACEPALEEAAQFNPEAKEPKSQCLPLGRGTTVVPNDHDGVAVAAGDATAVEAAAELNPEIEPTRSSSKSRSPHTIAM